MSSDKKGRGRLVRATIRSDLTATDDSFDETHSAPGTSRRDHSGDYTSTSKFVEAMNNPDWRRRNGHNTSETMTTATSDGKVLSSRTQESSRTSADDEVPRSCIEITATSSWDYINSANNLEPSHDSSEVGVSDKHADSVDGPCEAQEGPDLSTTNDLDVNDQNSGLYTLVGQSDLLGLRSRNRQVSILRITPFSSGDRPSVYRGGESSVSTEVLPIVHIQRVRGRPRQRQHEPENLLARISERSRALSPSPPSQRKQKDGPIMRPSKEETLERARNAVLEDPAVANIRSTHLQSQFEPKINQSSASPVDRPRKEEELSTRHAAFEKLIQKLQIGTAPVSKAAKQGDSHHDHGYPWGPKANQRPHQPTQIPNVNSHDSGIGSLPSGGPESTEISQDSRIRVDPETLSKGLNPRAREFLSFNRSLETIAVGQEIPSLQNSLSFQSLGLDENGQRGSTGTDKTAATDSARLVDSVSMMQPDFYTKGGNVSLGPGPGAIHATNTDPAVTGYVPNAVPSSSFVFPLGACQPSAQNVGMLSGLGLSVTWPAPGAFESQFGLPGINQFLQPLAVPPTPFPGNTSGPQAPYIPTPGNSRLPTRPRPVIKPANPNTAQQQNYEAYVEWRKANEPGYAMACKSRQQRRAQRGSVLREMPSNQAPQPASQQA
ncbi:hypothetical protein F66182_10508 [Fusarium sp. NRRL 66182]|nr:hypothetical protein F66182_10508 [Fusarium sp. NRRL 66182]